MPVPLAYAACFVAAPIVSASCGVPVTSTALVNVTVTSIRSPRSKVSPTAGDPTATPATLGGPRAPSTLWAAAAAIAFAPSPKLAAVLPSRASAIPPPFNASALAPMPTPVESASAAITV